MKHCKRCNESKPAALFGKDKSQLDGLTSSCKACRKLSSAAHYKKYQAKRSAATAAWKQANPERVKGIKQKSALKHPETARKHRLKRFGLTPACYNKMLEEQAGLCAICKQVESAKCNGRVKALAVDHNHITGKVRGLLCMRCNTDVGKVENLSRIQAIQQYLTARD